MNILPQDLPTLFAGIESSQDIGDLKEFGKDWTKKFLPDPSIILFPKNTDEVSQILKICNDKKIPVVPSGGRTGLAGGAVAAHKEVVLSLSKMNRMGEVDVLARTLWVQAGAVTEAVHNHCEEKNLTWPVDFASKGSSQVGGNISTNAGGVRVIRYGLTRNWILGLTVVLPSGEILRLNGALEKNNTGIDLKQCFISSEGTLGVVTEAILKLAPTPHEPDTFYFSCDSIEQVMNLFRQVRQLPWTLNAFETLSRACMKSCVDYMGNRAPFTELPPYAVLIEAEGADEAGLEELLESGFVTDGVQAETPEQTRDFWRIRENITESLVKRSLVHKHDVSLPVAVLAQFMNEFDREVLNFPELEIFTFGHIGDGNLHINYLKPAQLDRDSFYQRAEALDHRMFLLLQKFSGSVSAEHGIGLIKKNWLPFSKSKAELELMRNLKRTFDPNGILNPGKILDT